MKQAEVKKKTRPKKSVSFQDVARLAKVSTATVSRVARGNASVDEDMERRIRDAAEKLGLSLEDSRHDRLSTIAFLLCNRDVHHTFQSLVLLGAEAYCAANERELLFISFRYPTECSGESIASAPSIRKIRLGARRRPKWYELRAHAGIATVAQDTLRGSREQRDRRLAARRISLRFFG